MTVLLKPSFIKLILFPFGWEILPLSPGKGSGSLNLWLEVQPIKKIIKIKKQNRLTFLCFEKNFIFFSNKYLIMSLFPKLISLKQGKNEIRLRFYLIITVKKQTPVNKTEDLRHNPDENYQY